MYEIEYQGRMICKIQEKYGSTTPTFNVGDTVNIGGVNFTITDRKFEIQLNPLELNVGNISKIRLNVIKEIN